MAYSKFSANELIQNFGITFSATQLFSNITPLAPTDWLITSLTKGQAAGFSTEKSRSERLVTPILLELSEHNQHNFTIYSGVNLDIDRDLGLAGECDFVFSFSQIQDFVTAPIFCITEAKNQNLEQGIIQAAAQLIGATKFNEWEGNSVDKLYGCSTTGIEWRFLKYENKKIALDKRRYLISQLDELLGVLQCIIESSRYSVKTTN